MPGADLGAPARGADSAWRIGRFGRAEGGWGEHLVGYLCRNRAVQWVCDSGPKCRAITLGLTGGRLIAHQQEHRFRDMVIFRASAPLALPAFVILSMARSPPTALLGFFIAGVGVGPVEPAAFRSVSKRHPEADLGRALALVTGLAYVGFLVSPPLMGTVIDMQGWGVMWLVMCLFSLAASAFTLRIPSAPKG